MKLLFSNNATTEIAGSITSSDTTVQLAAGTGNEFPNPVSGSEYFVATFNDQATMTQTEIVWVTQRTGDTLTIMRGMETTPAQNWAAGDIFSNLLTAGQMGAFIQATGISYLADTSILYYGDDAGFANEFVVTNTVPPTTSLVKGMTFVIMPKFNNDSSMQAIINGKPAAAVQRRNGNPMVGGDVKAGIPIVLIWDGTAYVSSVPDIQTNPPQFDFYVRTDGNDANSGFANTAASAFKTGQGAVAAISARYTTSGTVTVHFAAGTYANGGVNVENTTVSGWLFLGDSTTPANVIMDATTATANTNGRGFIAGQGSVIEIAGFKIKSLLENAGCFANAAMSMRDCILTTPTNASAPVLSWNAGDYGLLYGNITYQGTGTCSAFLTISSSFLNIAYIDPVAAPIYLNVAFSGTCAFSSGFIAAQFSGTVIVHAGQTSFTNGAIVTGPRYVTVMNGIIGGTGSATFFPGNAVGVSNTGGQYS